MSGADLTASWDILVCSIVHRTDKLARLLSVLGPQIQPGVRVLVCRDNLEASVPRKRQALLNASTADYVSFIDDDDLVPCYYVEAVKRAIAREPQYIGFELLLIQDGVPSVVPTVHSLMFDGWSETPVMYCRDISHLNPIRRDIAVQAPWPADWPGEDVAWAERIRAIGVSRQVFIPRFMYFYLFSPADSHAIYRVPLRPRHIPPLPDLSFVEWVSA